MAVAGDRLLDARGIVTQHRHAAQTGRQQNHPAGMGHQDGRARMLVVGIELFHHDNSRSILFHHFNYTIVQHLEARSHVNCGAALRAADDAGLANVGRERTYF